VKLLLEEKSNDGRAYHRQTVQHRIVQGPAARAALLRGAERMTALIRPTLGPVARTVAIGRMVGNDPPEVLDSGAIIARRTHQLADPFEDIGAMLIRHTAWRTYDTVGDGSATAAVIAHALLRRGLSYLAAGGNPVGVRRGLECGLNVAIAQLERQARTIDGPAEIARVIHGSVADSGLAEMLGEVIDAAGTDGAILVEDAQTTRTTHEYLDGVRWNEGYLSSFLLRKDETDSSRLLNPRILITDHVLNRADDLLPVLEACVGAGERSLFIVAPEIGDSAIGLLVANRERDVLEHAMVVRAPSVGEQRGRILEDLAIATGGRCISQARGDRLSDVRLEDLGRARQAWATRVAFGILGGAGSRSRIRERITEVRAELAQIPKMDVFATSKVQERIGKLAGTSVIVRVGAPTAAEQAELKVRVEAAIRSARAGLAHGVVPGGGAALVRCIPTLESLECAADERVGVQALTSALEEPTRVIARNAGFEAEPIVCRARGSQEVFDVLERGWVDAWAQGLIDPLEVVRTALEVSVSSAAVALTTDVLIHRKDAPVSVEP
jgi:chaperonin GroEL